MTTPSSPVCDHFIHFPSALEEVIAHTHALSSREGSDITGIPTGFLDLDRRTDGLQPGQLIVVAARPSMGLGPFSAHMAIQTAIECALSDD